MMRLARHRQQGVRKSEQVTAVVGVGRPGDVASPVTLANMSSLLQLSTARRNRTPPVVVPTRRSTFNTPHPTFRSFQLWTGATTVPVASCPVRGKKIAPASNATNRSMGAAWHQNGGGLGRGPVHQPGKPIARRLLHRRQHHWPLHASILPIRLASGKPRVLFLRMTPQTRSLHLVLLHLGHQGADMKVSHNILLLRSSESLNRV